MSVTANKKSKKNSITPVKKSKKKISQFNIAIVLDESGSMGPYKDHVLKALDENFKQLQAESIKNKIPTFLSLITFNDKATICMEDENISHITSLNTDGYRPDGWTALNDGIANAIDILGSRTRTNHENLVIVITDGEENKSTMSSSHLTRIIKNCIKEDNWDFAIAGPKSIRTSVLCAISELKDCITTWEGTQQSIKYLSSQNNAGISHKYSMMRSGIGGQSCFYAPDLNDLTKKEVKSTLDDVTSRYAKIVVGNPTDLTISTVVREAGFDFMVGNGYYQLTKKEQVQDYKNIIVQNNATGELFSGNQDSVRTLLGLPTGGTIELNPTFSSKFTVFVRSTSWNRKLVPGTILLYGKN